MIHEADLLRFLLPAIPGRFQGLLIYLLDSLHSDSPAALISDCACGHLVRTVKECSDRKGLKPGIRRHIAAKLYPSQGPLQRLYPGIFP